ncbi:MAG: hypothetical protein WDO73_25240 [Ignavibacteriota bacterium]
MASIIVLPKPVQGREPQPSQAKQKRRYPKRMPSSLQPAQRVSALQSARQGRSVHEVSLEHSVSAIVTIEIWLRNLDRRLSLLERIPA